MNIITRQEWNAISPVGGYATSGQKLLVVIHHSYIPHVDCGVAKSVEQAHMQSMDRYHSQQGWGGIGYNWLAFQSGNIYEGRGWGRTGAHTVGRNSSSYGICLVIDGTENRPTAALLEAVNAIIAEGVRLGHLSAAHVRKPHDAFQQKDCPGRLVKQSGILLNRAVPVLDTAGSLSRPTLRHGKGGSGAAGDIIAAVKELQRLLEQPVKYQTGYFGDITEAAVREYQRANGLEDDGIVGPATWASLLD